MQKIVVRFLGTIAGLFIAERLLDGVIISGFFEAALFALLLGILNLIVRPILVVITLPVTIITLGLFLFIINAFLFLSASILIDGVHVENLVAALWASLIVSIVSWFVQKIV